MTREPIQPLRTVRVPEGLRELFARAEEVVSGYFSERVHHPERGSIEIQGERYVLVRAASLSVSFFEFVRGVFGADREVEADSFARLILFDLAHAIGRADAKNLHARMGLVDPVAKLSAGPVHFAHTGWAFVDILPDSAPSPDDDFFLVYEHPYSFESDAWLRAGVATRFAVCVMNAGYSSGWCEESFGVHLIASEILCRARGDECCRFVMAPPARIEGQLARWLQGRPELAPRLATVHLSDFVARKRLEEELVHSREELERRVSARTAELESANRRLREEMLERETAERRLQQAQKLEALGRLAGGVAHDFNNLLTAIGGYAELAIDQLSGEDPARECVREILLASERAAGLTRQLLAFGRQARQEPRVLDPGEVVERMANLLRRLIGEDVELVVETGANRARVFLDPSQLEQILVNLAVNARDAMPRGGRLLLALETRRLERAIELSGASLPPGEYVVLLAQDDGSGMSEETRTRLFEPFFTTKAPGQGTGLGLATVHGIVTQCGGGIEVETSVGRGSSFRVFLPVAGPAQDVAAPLAPQIEPRGTGCVLLVEDAPAVRRLARAILVAQGYEVLEASTPEEARRLFSVAAERVQLLLSDVIMPGMRGTDLADEFRAQRPDLPVLFMSGYSFDALEGRTGTGPRSGYLQKPFSSDELLAKVRELVQHGAG